MDSFAQAIAHHISNSNALYIGNALPLECAGHILRRDCSTLRMVLNGSSRSIMRLVSVL
jgi:hypothetical protein